MRKLCIGDIHGAKKALDQVLERANFDPSSDRLIFLGDVADGFPEVPEVFEFILGLDNYGYVMGNHDCLSSDTELLTKRGWIYYEEIQSDDIIFSLNTKSNIGEWTHINQIIIKKHSGLLNRIKTNHIDLLCTDSHRILHKTRSIDMWAYKTISDLPHRTIIPVAAISESDGIDVSDDELKLIAWILTDGSVWKTKRGTCRTFSIYQSKPNMVLRIRELLQRLDYPYSEYTRHNNPGLIRGVKVKTSKQQHIFRIKREGCRKVERYFKEKKPFQNSLFDMSNRQFSVFLAELILGDGTVVKHSNNCFVLYGEKEFLYNIQTLCSINGLRAWVKENTRGDHVLNISRTDTTSFDVPLNSSTEQYVGNVWCLSVPNTNFMVRRNGKVFFTGNSWLYEYLKFSATPRIWLSQGGQATLDAYLNYASPPMNDRHMGLLDRAVYYLEEDGNLFVHGGFLTAFPIKNQAPYDLMWDRDLWWNAKFYEATQDKPIAPGYKQVFIGHTSTSHERSDLTPIKASNVWNLDQGGGFEGKLTCMDVETNEFWQSDIVKELYPGVQGR